MLYKNWKYKFLYPTVSMEQFPRLKIKRKIELFVSLNHLQFIEHTGGLRIYEKVDTLKQREKQMRLSCKSIRMHFAI